MAQEMRPRARPQGGVVAGDGAAHQGRSRRPRRCRRHDRGPHRRDRLGRLRGRPRAGGALPRGGRRHPVRRGAAQRGRSRPGAEAAGRAVPRQHGRRRPHASAAVPAARAARLQARDLSQFADAPVRPCRPGPAGLAQDARATPPPWPTRCSTTASSGRCSRTNAGRRWRNVSRASCFQPPPSYGGGAEGRRGRASVETTPNSRSSHVEDRLCGLPPPYPPPSDGGGKRDSSAGPCRYGQSPRSRPGSRARRARSPRPGSRPGSCR